MFNREKEREREREERGKRKEKRVEREERGEWVLHADMDATSTLNGHYNTI